MFSQKSQRVGRKANCKNEDELYVEVKDASKKNLLLQGLNLFGPWMECLDRMTKFLLSAMNLTAKHCKTDLMLVGLIPHDYGLLCS